MDVCYISSYVSNKEYKYEECQNILIIKIRLCWKLIKNVSNTLMILIAEIIISI